MSSYHPFLSSITDSDKDALSIGLDALQICAKVLSDEISSSEKILSHIVDCLVPAAQSVEEAAKFRLDKLKNQPRLSSLCGECKQVVPLVCFHNEMTRDHTFQGMMEEHNCIYCGIEFRVASISLQKPILPPDSIFFLNEASRVRHDCSDIRNGRSHLKLREYLSYTNDSHESVVPSWSNQLSYFNDHSRANTIQEKNGGLENALATVMDQILIASKNREDLRYSILKWEVYIRDSKKALHEVMEDISCMKQAEYQNRFDDLFERLERLGRRPDQLGQVSEERKCNICLEHEKEIIFQCGHQACSSCSLRIQHCHVCRSTIQQRIKFYD
jgi:hypothetical protein